MKQKKQRRPQRQAAEMYGHFSAWEKSGQSQRAFMAAQGLSKSVFGYWWRKYREQRVEASGGGFVTVAASVAEGPVAPEQVFARIQAGSERELILCQAVSSAYLRELLGW